MTSETQNTRAARATAIHAMVAVLLALMVSAAGPLGGPAKECAAADIRLVQCSAEHAAAIRVAVLPDCKSAPSVEGRATAQVPTQLVRAADRARWSCALPPPARV